MQRASCFFCPYQAIEVNHKGTAANFCLIIDQSRDCHFLPSLPSEQIVYIHITTVVDLVQSTGSKDQAIHIQLVQLGNTVFRGTLNHLETWSIHICSLRTEHVDQPKLTYDKPKFFESTLLFFALPHFLHSKYTHRSPTVIHNH